MTERRGNCPSTGKRMFSTRGDAKRFIARHHWNAAAFKCDTCGAFHMGGWQGVKDRAVHREIHTGGAVDAIDISVRMAAEELCVSVELLGQLLDNGKINARLNGSGKWRIPTTEIQRLKTLLMEDA